MFTGGGRLLAARFVIPEHETIADDIRGRYLLQYYDILKKTNIDGKLFYGVQTNYHFSINIIFIKAVFAAINHGVRVYYEKCAHKRIMRNGISGFRRDVDEICAFLRYYAVWGSKSLQTFRDKLAVPSSRVKKSKNGFQIL
jgi:hypothetical protein